MSDEKSLGVQRATTCRYSDCDLPIVACAFYSVAMASDCERCDNYKPRSEEAEAMKCPECGSELPLDRVRVFFEEHPVHVFSPKTIATYLGMSEMQVNRALNALILEVEGFVSTGFRLVHPEQLVEKVKSATGDAGARTQARARVRGKVK